MIQCHASFMCPVLVRPVPVMPVRVPSVTPAYENPPFNHTYPCEPFKSPCKPLHPYELIINPCMSL